MGPASSNRSSVFHAFAQPVDGSEAAQLTRSEADAIITQAYFGTCACPSGYRWPADCTFGALNFD